MSTTPDISLTMKYCSSTTFRLGAAVLSSDDGALSSEGSCEAEISVETGLALFDVAELVTVADWAAAKLGSESCELSEEPNEQAVNAPARAAQEMIENS